MKRQGIYTFTPENAVLLRNILVSAPIRKPGRGGYVDSCRVPALFRSTNLKLFYLRSINPMIEKINPTIPIPITSSPIPDEQRESIMAKSSIAIPNPIFFIVNTHGWLKTSENMVRIFIVLSLVVAIMTAPVFSGEYGGVDNIILTSKYGKTKCATAKIIGSILAALIVTIVVSAINLIYAFILYGNGGLDCSILFAPADFVEGYIPFNITCGTLLKYQILLAFTNTISITGITLVLSAVCKNQMVALVASAAIYLFPIMLPVTETSPLFKIITLLPLYHAQFVSLMSVEQISGNVLYALMAVPVALILMGIGVFISRRIFAKHQVS